MVCFHRQGVEKLEIYPAVVCKKAGNLYTVNEVQIKERNSFKTFFGFFFARVLADNSEILEGVRMVLGSNGKLLK